jgi:hypothetical protein
MANNLQEIYEELQKLREENTKFRRLYEDTIYNLDEDNFPGFNKVIRAVNETYENVAQIQGQVTSQGAMISQIVSSRVEDGETVYEANASFIIAAINGQSTAKIKADLIEMTGTTVFLTAADVGASGTTTIHGDRVRLGSLISNNYKEVDGNVTAGMKIDLNNGTITSKNFKLDSSGNVSITGIINATTGVIGSGVSYPWIVGTNPETGHASIWNSKQARDLNTVPGIYIGTDGIAVGCTVFGDAMSGPTKIMPNGVIKTSSIRFVNPPDIGDTDHGAFISISSTDSSLSILNTGSTYILSNDVLHLTAQYGIKLNSPVELKTLRFTKGTKVTHPIGIQVLKEGNVLWEEDDYTLTISNYGVTSSDYRQIIIGTSGQLHLYATEGVYINGVPFG